MSLPSDRASRSAEAMRLEFDRSFALPPATRVTQEEEFLAVRIGGDAYALRTAEIIGLHADRKLVPVPSASPVLLGIVAVRGVIAPAYDLPALLGYARVPSLLRWLVFLRASEPVAVSFDRVDAHLRLPSDQVSSAESHEHARQHVRGSVQTSSGPLPLIHCGSILSAIAQLKER
jgi:purine-binding chemotaxis protein CheW